MMELEINSILNKVAEINVLMNSALDADKDWQKKFIKDQWISCRQSLIEDIMEIVGGENDDQKGLNVQHPKILCKLQR